MNKECFQVVFSKSQQQFVVVSELAKSAGKSSTVPKAKVDDLFALLYENLFGNKDPNLNLITSKIDSTIESVTLPNGKIEQVLVPKVYALAQKGDITGKGALLSGKQVSHSGGELINSGTIAGRELVQLDSQSVKNTGTISAGILSGDVKGDLDNLGGTLEADRAILLNVTGNITHGSTLHSTEVNNKGYQRSETTVGRKGLIHVKGEDGVLQLKSGGDFTVSGADIINNGQGQTYLSANGSFALNALQTGFDEKMGSGDHYRNQAISDVEVSRIAGNGNVTLKGGSIYSEGADIDAKARLALLAENDIVLGTATRQTAYEEYHKTKSGSAVSRKTREQYNDEQTLTHKGTTLAASDIVLDANRITLTGTQGMALNNITVTAKEGLLLDAAVNQHDELAWASTKKSGVTASAQKGVASVGIGKQKTQTHENRAGESLLTTRLNTFGNLTLSVEKGDITANAAELNTRNDMTLSGKNVSLNSLNTHEASHFNTYTKSSGIGTSLVYSPSQAFKANLGEQSAQGSAVGIIGQLFMTADALAKTTNQLLNPGGMYAYTQRHQVEKNQYQSNARVTTANVGGNLKITATDGSITSQGAQLSAQGDGELWAKEGIHLGVAVSTSSQNARENRKGASIDMSKLSVGANADKNLGQGESRFEQASVLSFGGNASLTAQDGDIIFNGTQAVADGSFDVSAGHNITITTATQHTGMSESQTGHAWGDVMISDTERFNGYNRKLHSQNGEQVSHQQAMIASLNDSVSFNAGQDFSATSSQILAKTSVKIDAEQVTFDSTHNIGNSQSHQSDLKIGEFSRVSSPLIDLIQTVEQAVNNKNASDRIKAAQAMGAAANAYTTAANLANGGALFRVETGTGFSHSRAKNQTASRESVGNQVNAQHIDITSRSGDINATHTAFTSKDEQGNRIVDSSVTFDSARDINFSAGQSEYQQQGRQQSSGFEVGTGVAVGAQTGWYFYAQAGFSNGKQDERHLAHHNSQIDSETINIRSQGDTNLKGATAKANRINAEIQGKLTIESLQDEHRSNSSSAGVGGRVQAAIGTAWGASGYGNLASGNANAKQVAEQSGLFAEDGGYNVSANEVSLIGGAIASTSPENSTLTTNTITFTDIQNESSSQAVSAGISASANLNKQAGTEAKTEAEAKQQAKVAKLTGTPQSNGINPSVPMFDSSRDSSTTKATLTEGTIILHKDSNPTQTTAAALGINTDLSQANRQVAQPKKDINQVLQEQQVFSQAIGNMQEAANTYAEQKAKVAAEAVNKAEEALQAAEKSGDIAKINEKQTAYAEAKARKESWEDSGANKRRMDAAVMAITTVLSGGNAGQTAVAALSPELNAQIHELTKDSKTANLLAHAALSALEAKANGTSATAGAIAGVAGEATAMLLAETVFNKQPNELTAEEKNLLKVAGQLAGVVSGNLAGSTTADTVFGAGTAKRAVENNYLYVEEAKEKLVLQRKKADGTATEADLVRLDEINRIDKARDQEIEEACSQISSEKCLSLAQNAQYAQRGYETYFSYRGQYKDLFPVDFANVEQILSGKDADSVYIEKVALGIAKSENISLEAAKSKVENIMLFKNFAELVGAVRAGTAVKYGKKITVEPVNYPNQTTNISLNGAENAINAVKLKEQLSNEVLRSQGTKFDELLVSARAEIDGKVYIDTNQNARSSILANPNKPTLIAENIASKKPIKNGGTYPNANMAEAHAEIGAIQQAYEKGVTKGKDMVIHVQGRDVCTYCRNDIATAAKKAGLKSVTVHAINKDGKPVVYDWNATMNSIKLRKE